VKSEVKFLLFSQQLVYKHAAVRFSLQQ